VGWTVFSLDVSHFMMEDGNSASGSCNCRIAGADVRYLKIHMEKTKKQKDKTLATNKRR
jgi:hypothetical protein